MKKSRTRFTSIACILVGFAISPAVALADEASDLAEVAVAEAMIAWEAAQYSENSEDVFAFIQAHPNSQHVNDAKALMIDLLWLEMAREDAKPTPEVEDVAAAVGGEGGIEDKNVELKSNDGFVALSGIIVDFDDALITIETSQGVLGIPREGIVCFGAACPPELLAAR